MGLLDNKVAVITGGISGLGRASALRYAAEGARVVVADINAERGANAAAEMSAGGASIEFIQVDVTSKESQQALFDDVVSRYGQVDTVLAAAGVSSSGYISGEVSEVEADPEERMFHNRMLEDWEKVMAVNVTGVMLTNQMAIKHMLAKGNAGSIVNIASIAGRRPLPGASDYCVSKAAVIMLTQTVATEYSTSNIRVNAIGPGFIETPMTANIRQSPEWMDTVMQMTPMQRMGQANEIASTALFLASEESSYFTGQTLFPNGGMFTG
ncbi:MAG: SDR family NAD(P)-dependent oxidoreductase [Pseudomonadales bacterium]|jgi:NAD(P)-dependent dehydrogenase (short-subunit alcohol dehydrogenase family)|nr:oxidoreductase [Gammaproteobacteria bacterium]MDP6187316.1 SDR family NAD(P)-dependent oxidoreductase [Pseudomonadales bacterium]RPG30475.1 MAG: SDR family oxidoreductase [Gammaproteobacteria bacterium TMED243]